MSANGPDMEMGAMLSNGMVQVMVQVAVILAVMVLITSRIFQALPDVSGPMSTASDQVATLTGTAFELAPIVLIVIVAASIIQVVKTI